MNGRIYDPTLGRFLQADPHIQAPKNSQSYNRYSYVLNNPMSYTDPSGYFFNKLFKGINKALGKFAPVFGIALMFIPGMQAWAAQSLWHAAAVGFGVGGVSTGSLKGALIGAFSGAAFHQIGSHFGDKFGKFADATFDQQAQWAGSQALVGGIGSSLSGGKFGHGFFSAGFTKFAMGNAGFDYSNQSTDAVAGRVAIAAMVGGTASVISGGKFANGAQTAAMAQLFNAEAANSRRIDAVAEKLKWSKARGKQFGKLLKTIADMGANIQESQDLEKTLRSLSTEQLGILARNPALAGTGISNFYNHPEYVIEGIMYYDDIDTFRTQLGLAANAVKYSQQALYVSPIVTSLVAGTPKWFQQGYTKFSDVNFAKDIIK